MIKAAHRFILSTEGVTAIEYALLASGVALAIVTAVGAVGTSLSASFTNIANAFPQ
jgi:pilus assembly protein Flp/PilA